MACPVCGRDYLTLALDETCCPGPAPSRVRGRGPAPDREKTEAVLTLRALGFTGREIGERLGMDPRAVYSQVDKARRRGQTVASRRRGWRRELQGAGRS